MTDEEKAFIEALIVHAYMADAITAQERALALQILKRQGIENETNRSSVGKGANPVWSST